MFSKSNPNPRTNLPDPNTLPRPSSINELARAYERMADAQDKAALAQERLNNATKGSNVNTAPPPVVAPPVLFPTGNVSGPFSRYTNINQKYEAAVQQMTRSPSSVSTDVFKDISYQRDVAASRLAKITNANQTPEMQKAVMQMISTSRFGSGSGMMPLVSKVQGVASAALGPEAAALGGPVTLAAAAFVEAAKAVYEFSDQAAKSGRELAAVRFATGASNIQASTLQMYSKSLGVDFAGMAEGLNDKISTDPTARAFASKFGASNIAGPYGSTNTAENLLKVVEGLRSIENEQERLRTAKVLGVTGALPLTQISGSTFSTLKNDASISSQIQDSRFQKDAAEFGAAQGRLTSGFEAMTSAMSKNFFPVIIPAMNGMADAEYALAAFANGDIKNSVIYGAKAMQNFGISGYNGGVASLMPGLPADAKPFLKGSYQDGAGGGNPPLDANTQMLMKVALALGSLEKALGGGERARGAVPGGLTTQHHARPDELAMLRRGPL